MSRFDKILMSALSGNSDNKIRFKEVCLLLEKLGFELRIKGSHHIFFKDGIDDIINIQEKKGIAKPYQIKQIRNIIIQNKLQVLDK